ncbi:hypothetical protein F4802DRAFT_616651 [Xylaria palmicola]|nr:hypothetical protein F4802DRAFT_616651 [Xylaria palmicola]
MNRRVRERDEVEARWRRGEEAHRQLQQIFAVNKLWELEKYLGQGSYGVTVLLKARDPFHIRSRRRVVLKRAVPRIGNETTQDFAREIKALNHVRGKAHHAQIIEGTTDVTKFWTGDGRARLALRKIFAPFRNRNPVSVLKILSGYNGPAILLEYIENGSLVQFHNKVRQHGVRLPNRLLWSFYFCLVRACAGMHFHHPPQPQQGEPPVLEGIPTNKQPLPFAHNDIFERNVMMGDWEPHVPEHQVGTNMKLIDYGICTTNISGSDSMLDNLLGVTLIIVRLILGHDPDISVENATQYKGRATFATDILPGLTEEGHPYDPFPDLDTDLRDLIAEVLTRELSDRPRIAEVFRRVQAGMQKPASAYPPAALEEGDVLIRRLMQLLLYEL